MRFAVDLPNPDPEQEKVCVGYAATRDEAVQIARQFGADAQGRVQLVSELPSDEPERVRYTYGIFPIADDGGSSDALISGDETTDIARDVEVAILTVPEADHLEIVVEHDRRSS